MLFTRFKLIRTTNYSFRVRKTTLRYARYPYSCGDPFCFGAFEFEHKTQHVFTKTTGFIIVSLTHELYLFEYTHNAVELKIRLRQPDDACCTRVLYSRKPNATTYVAKNPNSFPNTSCVNQFELFINYTTRTRTSLPFPHLRAHSIRVKRQRHRARHYTRTSFVCGAYLRTVSNNKGTRFHVVNATETQTPTPQSKADYLHRHRPNFTLRNCLTTWVETHTVPTVISCSYDRWIRKSSHGATNLKNLRRAVSNKCARNQTANTCTNFVLTHKSTVLEAVGDPISRHIPFRKFFRRIHSPTVTSMPSSKLISLSNITSSFLV